MRYEIKFISLFDTFRYKFIVKVIIGNKLVGLFSGKREFTLKTETVRVCVCVRV